MARRTTFYLQRCVLKRERSLLVGVTFETARIGACCQPRLLQFETTVRIVTVAAFDQAFEDLVMKRPAELCFRFTVTTDAQLRLASFEHVRCQQIAVSPG